MRTSVQVSVVGGGPGGLFVARQVKRQHPDWTVELFERNRPEFVAGFGVSLGGQVLDVVAGVDPEVHDDLLRHGSGRDSSQRLVVPSGAADWAWGGWKSLSIARTKLISSLQARAEEAGVVLHFSAPRTVEELSGSDLIIAADGAKSLTRESRKAHFRPSARPGRGKTIWLGAEAASIIDRSMFVIKENEHGTWALHAYPHGDGMATLVIEANDDALERAGLAEASRIAEEQGRPDLVSRDYLGVLYADYLGGAELLMSNSRWFNFSLIRNERWSHENIVLLGDAAHTAHPSIGSGTRMALEDGIALAGALSTADLVDQALQDYELIRRPLVEKLQSAALPSQRWWETVHERTGLSPERLALNYISRTGFYPISRFERKDPAFARSVTESFLEEYHADSESTPMDADLPLGRSAVVGRWLSRVAAGAVDSMPTGSTGLSVLEFGPDDMAGMATTEIAPGVAGVSLQLDDGDQLIDVASTLGSRFVELRVEASALDASSPRDIARWAADWSRVAPEDSLGLGLCIVGLPDSPDDPSMDLLLATAESLGAAGISLLTLRSRASAVAGGRSPAADLEMADRIRARAGVPVALEGAGLDGDMLATAVLAGRIQLAGLPVG